MKVLNCIILRRNTDERSPICGDYESLLEVEFEGGSYHVKRVTSWRMVEGGFISKASQRAYLQYEMVKEITNGVEMELHSQINALNICDRVKPL